MIYSLDLVTQIDLLSDLLIDIINFQAHFHFFDQVHDFIKYKSDLFCRNVIQFIILLIQEIVVIRMIRLNLL